MIVIFNIKFQADSRRRRAEFQVGDYVMVRIRPERYPSGHFDVPTDPFSEPTHEPTIDNPTTSDITPAPLPNSPAPKEHIDAILDEQIISTRDGGVQRFLVRWSGRPASDDTWITSEDLQQIDRDLFEYYQSRPAIHSTESSFSSPWESWWGHRIQTSYYPCLWPQIQEGVPTLAELGPTPPPSCRSIASSVGSLSRILVETLPDINSGRARARTTFRLSLYNKLRGVLETWLGQPPTNTVVGGSRHARATIYKAKTYALKELFPENNSSGRAHSFCVTARPPQPATIHSHLQPPMDHHRPILMASQSNNRSGSRETQGEPSHAPRTPSDRGAKLLAKTQRMAKASSRQRPGWLLPEGKDSQDINIKRLQAQMAEMTQILVDNKLMKPAQIAVGGPFKGVYGLKRQTHLREFRRKSDARGRVSYRYNSSGRGSIQNVKGKEKTRAKEADVKPNTRFDWNNGETDDTMEDLPLGTIHMIGGPNHPNHKNRIQREIHIVKQIYKVLSVQPMAKKPRQTVIEPGSITFSKADLEWHHILQSISSSILLKFKISSKS
ncbi:hypothetical protein Acr_00g0049800 [Actinidia rufa]|uniref:Chromo domain-containing protein n=1 Tax=Actinidia rufa TaxID=165716 RepID=A0A7J0DKG0_9ERIC|nr:hypothetical protein Acr_00g0049800 [Actinidia rufa]